MACANGWGLNADSIEDDNRRVRIQCGRRRRSLLDDRKVMKENLDKFHHDGRDRFLQERPALHEHQAVAFTCRAARPSWSPRFVG